MDDIPFDDRGAMYGLNIIFLMVSYISITFLTIIGIEWIKGYKKQ